MTFLLNFTKIYLASMRAISLITFVLCVFEQELHGLKNFPVFGCDRAPLTSKFSISANPVTQDGSNYRGDITESEAFLWFDESLIHVRGGSGGVGSAAFKFGRNRQHMAPSGGNGGDGGAVLFFGDESFNTLFGFRGRSTFRAENGGDGGPNFANGMKVYLAMHLYTPPHSQIRM